MVAREVTGDEKSLWWERAVAAYPDYADYQAEDRPGHPGLRARAGRLTGSHRAYRLSRLSARRSADSPARLSGFWTTSASR